MRISRAVVPALLGLFLAGCRGDPSRDLLERDNFQKGREINELKWRVEDLEEQLRAATGTQPAIGRPAMPSDMSSEPRRIESISPGVPTTRPGPALTPPSRQPDQAPSPGLTPLEVSPGVETPSGEVPKTFQGPAGPAPGRSSLWRPSDVQLASGTVDREDFRRDRSVAPAAQQGSEKGIVPSTADIAQITLHPSLTGGIGSTVAGDEGLLVVVEPRDFAGNIVPAPGETSVALIDPALSGEQARLARWDFTAAQTERMLHSGAEPGIHLRLMWRSLPEHDRLKVFVRYTTRDGRKLQAERIIAVATGGPGLRTETDTEPFSSDRASEVPRTRSSDSRPANPQRPQWSPQRD